MGDRLVFNSLTAPATRATTPMTRRIIVFEADPAPKICVCGCDEQAGCSHDVWLKLNPSKRQTTPATMSPSPMKSNSLTCC